MRQSQILKKMSGIKRLEQSFLLSDFVLEIAKKNIRENLGTKTTTKRINSELAKRLLS